MFAELPTAADHAGAPITQPLVADPDTRRPMFPESSAHAATCRHIASSAHTAAARSGDCATPGVGLCHVCVHIARRSLIFAPAHVAAPLT
jgi:hypothetical protein